MDAYAALLSLMHTINNIHNHPRPPISLHQQQRHSLTENLTFLQDFLERYSNKEDEDLERRITSAAHAAEDVIETHIVDQIEASIRNSYQLEAGTTNEPILALMLHKFRQLLRAVVAPCKAGVSTGHDVENIISLDHFHVDLGRAIQELDLIKKEAMVIAKEKKMGTQHHDDHLHTNASTWQSSSTMIVQDEDFVFEVLDKLVGQHSNLQIIPIVGMGGIGKTTLALNIYSNQLIVEHFDIFAWVIVSQEYSGPHEILLQVLGQENRGIDDELGMRVHKKLWDRRYLIVMDDIWSSKPWDEVKTYFPDNNNGSRIMITTRKSNLAFKLSGSHIINHMNFLDEDKSWCLLCDVVFGRELCCPRELEDTGKKIARNCRGLPLSIVVIGGLLKKSNMTRVYWEYILQNLSPLINLEEDEYCLQILSRSYKELPVHLKPCFLYMGMFPEDEEINVSDLINLWVAEGIVKPIDGKILEEAAEEYLKELVDRNLILVHKLWWNGKAKSCRMHDLVRDLCIREAKKQRFFWLASEQDETREGINMERRICINEYSPTHIQLVGLKSARSLLLRNEIDKPISRLLRVRYSFDMHHMDLNFDGAIQQLNLRFLFLNSMQFPLHSLLWNLQTLYLSSYSTRAAFDIWKMPLLRHARLREIQLSHPTEHNLVLKNLQTLKQVVDFSCDEETAKRIPNIKTLGVIYDVGKTCEWVTEFDLHLKYLQKLDALSIYNTYYSVTINVSFPDSLKELSLWGTDLHPEELTTRIASLPHLQLLIVGADSFRGYRWNCGEAQFGSLKYLIINKWCGLKYWTADDTSFPCLEQLLLRDLGQLEEIPPRIGDIPTLKTIQLEDCCKSATESAKRIKEEQEYNGNEDLQLSFSCIMDNIHF